MLSGWFLSVFFRSSICVVGPQLLGFLIVSTQPKRLFTWSAFVSEFVIFGGAFSLKVAIGFLKWTEDGDVVGMVIPLPGLILLLVGLELNRIFFMLRLLMVWLMLCVDLSFFFEEILEWGLDMFGCWFLREFDVDRRSVRFVDGAAK